ncbi:hypothetical protein BRD56_05365 [Thermoplasmatales archaeon SW_10_69_26]|nr:MAG: hypothetical protein BRD56_05365 [Thermoplasmatales archaeon SW_10_69_26]
MSQDADLPPDDRRCTATNNRGERCRKYAIKGGNVCEVHGGSAPQVKKKAGERMREAAAPAIHDLDTTRQEIRDILADLLDGLDAADLLESEDVDDEDLLHLAMSLSGHHEDLTADILDRAGYPKAERREIASDEANPLTLLIDSLRDDEPA